MKETVKSVKINIIIGHFEPKVYIETNILTIYNHWYIMDYNLLARYINKAVKNIMAFYPWCSDGRADGRREIVFVRAVSQKP